MYKFNIVGLYMHIIYRVFLQRISLNILSCEVIQKRNCWIFFILRNKYFFNFCFYKKRSKFKSFNDIPCKFHKRNHIMSDDLRLILYNHEGHLYYHNRKKQCDSKCHRSKDTNNKSADRYHQLYQQSETGDDILYNSRI